MISEEYPLGGMIEPYDIWREKELLQKQEKRSFDEWPDFGDDTCFAPGPDESEL